MQLFQAQSEDHEDDLAATDNTQRQFMEEFFEQVRILILISS